MEFIFGAEEKVPAAFKAAVAAGIKSKEALLKDVSRALQFPDYYGENWDALEECIRDLSWLPSGDVVLTHVDLPIPDDRASLAIYLAILNDAVARSRFTGERRLFVVFPPSVEGRVRSALAGT